MSCCSCSLVLQLPVLAGWLQLLADLAAEDSQQMRKYKWLDCLKIMSSSWRKGLDLSRVLSSCGESVIC